MAQKPSRKPKPNPQLKSLHKSGSKGTGRGAKTTTISLSLPTCSLSPCSTSGSLSGRASVDKELSSSSDSSFDPEPSESQGLPRPSQAMKLVLKDIAKANHARRTTKRKAIYEGYTSSLDEVVRRRSGRWMDEEQLKDEEWMKGVVERLGGMVSRKQEIEKRMVEVLGRWEVDFEKIVGTVGIAVGLKESGPWEEEGQNEGREEYEGKKWEGD